MPFTTLPNELILSIAAHLPLHSLSTLSRTNHHLHALLARPLLYAINDSNVVELLFWSATKGREDILHRVLEVGVDLHWSRSTKIRMSDWSVLDWAVHRGQSGIVRILLQQGTAKGPKCALTRALYSAAARGHNAIVGQLLDAGAGVNRVDGKGRTALGYACHYGHPETAKLLFARGAAGQNVLLLWAALARNVGVVKVLLDHGVPVNTRCWLQGEVRGVTALHLACGAGDEVMVNYLLDRGADINADADGDTPFRRAVMRVQWGVIQILLERRGGK